MSVFTPIPYSFDYWRFVVYFKVRKYVASGFVLSLDFFGYSESLALREIVLNQWIALGKLDIFSSIVY